MAGIALVSMWLLELRWWEQLRPVVLAAYRSSDGYNLFGFLGESQPRQVKPLYKKEINK